MTKVIPLTVWGTGTVLKSPIHYLSNIPGKHEIKELDKTAILCTAHILRKVLIFKCIIGIVITCTINCNCGMTATLCTVETWFVLGV